MNRYGNTNNNSSAIDKITFNIPKIIPFLFWFYCCTNQTFETTSRLNNLNDTLFLATYTKNIRAHFEREFIVCINRVIFSSYNSIHFYFTIEVLEKPLALDNSLVKSLKFSFWIPSCGTLSDANKISIPDEISGTERRDCRVLCLSLQSDELLCTMSWNKMKNKTQHGMNNDFTVSYCKHLKEFCLIAW